MSIADTAKRVYLQYLKNKMWEKYKNFDSCYCPALKTEVHFTPDGFYHLHTEPTGRVRKVAEQLHKLSKVPHTPKIITGHSGALKYDKRFGPVGRKKRSGKSVTKEFEYWGMSARIGRTKVTIIVRKAVGSEKTIFWSVM